MLPGKGNLLRTIFRSLLVGWAAEPDIPSIAQLARRHPSKEPPFPNSCATSGIGVRRLENIRPPDREIKRAVISAMFNSRDSGMAAATPGKPLARKLSSLFAALAKQPANPVTASFASIFRACAHGQV
jgi:hypothetical protein